MVELPNSMEPKSLSITPSNPSTSVYTESNVNKNLFYLRLPQQRIRLYSILEQIRETATIEGSTPVEIATLALQLLANEVDNRKVIVSSGGFIGINLNYVPMDMASYNHPDMSGRPRGSARSYPDFIRSSGKLRVIVNLYRGGSN